MKFKAKRLYGRDLKFEIRKQSLAIAMTLPFEKQTIEMNFSWFLTKWQPFVWISNSRAFGFQIQFAIRIIFKPTSFQPLKMQMHPDFKSPLYFVDLQLVAELSRFTSPWFDAFQTH